MMPFDIQADFMDFLKSKKVAVISTVSSDGKPESATIYFIVSENFTFYFMTKSFTRKYANLQHNPQVALVVGADNEPVTAQIQGMVTQVTDQKEFLERLDLLRKNFFENEFVAPLYQLAPERNDIVIFKITPSWIRWLDLRREKNKIDSGFVQILP
jgi:general stress protein 26